MAAAAAPAGGATLPQAFRVLAFEDNTNIKELLDEAGVLYGVLQQSWDSESAVEKIAAFRPDVLLLDYYMPPLTGLQVLNALNAAVAAGKLERPPFVLGISSVSACNSKMLAAGADAGYIKWDSPQWPGWAKR
jgi:CheY-like chemotaxis protein